MKGLVAGLNPVDWRLMAGGVGNWSYDFIPRPDGAGEINDVGVGGEGWEKGDEVFFTVIMGVQVGLLNSPWQQYGHTVHYQWLKPHKHIRPSLRSFHCLSIPD